MRCKTVSGKKLTRTVLGGLVVAAGVLLLALLGQVVLVVSRKAKCEA